MKKIFLGLVLSLALAACSGGSGTEPPVKVALRSSSQALELAAGDEVQLTIEGDWSGTNIQPDAVYLQARDTAGRFATPESKSGSSGATFTFTLYTLPSIKADTYTGTIEVRACKDPICAAPYPGASATVGYTLNVAAVAEWETHQRDAAHSGYVPIWLTPSRFAKAWEWSPEDDPAQPESINAVVTGNGKVYITNAVSFGQGVLYALKESDGAEAWRVSFGKVPLLNPPSVSNGTVYAAVSGQEDTALWAFNADTGAYLHKSQFESQWPYYLAPTVYGDQVYNGGGFSYDKIYSFSTTDGSRTWTHDGGGWTDMFTPAVDDSYVYHYNVHYNGNALFLIDRKTGSTTATISDPFRSTYTYSYCGAPMIGGRNNVLAFAGDAGWAGNEQRVFSSFNIKTKSYEWSTSHAYLTAPAVANGVFYAARNNPMSLDALDEATGQVLWSWAPSGNGDSSFHRNIVLTRNILFVSTDKAVYALDLATRTPVWSYPMPGMLVISADRTLYIATGAQESDGHLVAVKLK